MTEDEIVARADANYFEAMSAFAYVADGCEVRDGDGIRLVRSNMPVAWLNIAFITRPLLDPATQIRHAITYFDAHKLPFIVRVREGLDAAAERAVEAQGLHYTDSVPGLVLPRIGEPSSAPAPAQMEIRSARDAAVFIDHRQMVVSAFDMPDALAAQFFSERLLDVIDAELYVGYVDGQPVASSALIATHRVAGVYNVGCAPAYRRRGFGEAMTWHAVGRGAEMGCVVASLQASEMGRPIYERMGFRVVAQYRTFAR